MTIRDPVVIGTGCHIEQAVVGPHVSIGDNARVRGAAIQRSIVMDGTTLEGGFSVDRSIIGRNARITSRNSVGSGPSKLILGDNAVVEL